MGLDEGTVALKDRATPTLPATVPVQEHIAHGVELCLARGVRFFTCQCFAQQRIFLRERNGHLAAQQHAAQLSALVARLLGGGKCIITRL